MKLYLDWAAPISLLDGGDCNLIYTCDLDDLSDQPGIYIFGRRHGASFEALYVGKAGSLRDRVKTQFKNLPLMKHIEGARNGERVLLLGSFLARPGQREETCLPIMERALIRHYLELGHDLVNVQGAQLRTHEIASANARGWVPPNLIVDRD